jgi:hypothetical protein
MEFGSEFSGNMGSSMGTSTFATFPNNDMYSTTASGGYPQASGMMGDGRPSGGRNLNNNARGGNSAGSKQQAPQNDDGSGFGLGDIAASLIGGGSNGDVMKQIGISTGKKIVNQNMGSLYSWLAANRLKYYFLVDNRYVVKKIKMLLLPFLHKDWRRQKHPQGPQEVTGEWQLPCHDVNAPDLYVPTMAFITYTLLTGYVMGTFGQFDPEVFSTTAGASLVVLLVELFILKIGLHLTNAASPSWLDLVAYCGYKYVGAVVMGMVGLLLGRIALYLMALILGVSSAVFMMKTLKWASVSAREDNMADYPENEGLKRSFNYFLLFTAAFQILVFLLLLWTVIPPATQVVSLTPVLPPLQQTITAAAVPVDAAAVLAAAAVNGV